MVLKQLRFEYTYPEANHIDIISALKIVNDNTLPTKQAYHIDIHYYIIKDWREDGDIIMKHIPGIVNLFDYSKETPGYVLHANPCCHIMGYYT